MPSDTSQQLYKYSSRHKRAVKRTINPSKHTEEELKKIKEDFYREVDEDNKKFREEMKEIKKNITIPKRYRRVPIEEDNPPKTENIEVVATQLTPQGEIKTKIETNDGITTIKKEIKEETPDGEIKTIKKITSSKVDLLTDISTSQIMNNPDLIKNIENKSGNTFLLVGASKSGKTTYLIQLINALNQTYQTIYKKPIIVLFSETMANDGGIYNRLPANTVLFDHYEEKVIKTIEKVQKKTNKKYPVIIILDDVVDKKNNQTLSKLFTIYRNLNISSVVLLQRLKMFDKNNRSNVNYVLALKMNTTEAIQDMIDVFFKGQLTSDDYINLTNNYNKLFLDNLNNKTYKLKANN